MERWKGKGGRKIEEVVGRWNGKGERKVRGVNIKKINVKKNYKNIEKKKKNLKLERLQRFVLFCFLFFVFFPLPLSWKSSHKTLKLNWKGFELGLIVELNK